MTTSHQSSILEVYGINNNSNSDLDLDFVFDCDNILNRDDSIKKLNKYINYYPISFSIEESIFEYVVTYCFENKISLEFIESVYDYKLSDICTNIFDDKKLIINNFFLKGLKNLDIDWEKVAILPFYSIHPEKWENIINKRKIITETSSNLKTTDMYVCINKSCRSRNCFSIEKNTRCADEPMTTIVKCNDCGYKFSF
jgi:DNA-directed RNA polymerase subunit M/transcription elongation factor TFIIS